MNLRAVLKILLKLFSPLNYCFWPPYSQQTRKLYFSTARAEAANGEPVNAVAAGSSSQQNNEKDEAAKDEAAKDEAAKDDVKKDNQKDTAKAPAGKCHFENNLTWWQKTFFVACNL
jgi:hypothetical protein